MQTIPGLALKLQSLCETISCALAFTQLQQPELLAPDVDVHVTTPGPYTGSQTGGKGLESNDIQTTTRVGSVAGPGGMGRYGVCG